VAPGSESKPVEARGVGMTPEPSLQGSGETGAGGEREARSKPLYYKVTIVVKIDADHPEVKTLKGRLGSLVDLEFIIDDVRGVSRRFERIVAGAMPDPIAMKIRDKLAEIENLLKEAKGYIFLKLAELGEVKEVIEGEEW